MADAPERSSRTRQLTARAQAALDAKGYEKELAATERAAKAQEKEERRAEKQRLEREREIRRETEQLERRRRDEERAAAKAAAAAEKQRIADDRVAKAAAAAAEKKRAAAEKEARTALALVFKNAMILIEAKLAEQVLLPASSDAGGMTQSADAMLAALATAADATLAARPGRCKEMIAPFYEPLLSDAPSEATLAFAAAARALLHDAYGAGKKLGPKKAEDAEMLFEQMTTALHGESRVLQLQAQFQALTSAARGTQGRAAFSWLWLCVTDDFARANPRPAPKGSALVAARPTAVRSPSSSCRNVYAFVGGWALHRMQQRDEPSLRLAVSALVAPERGLPATEAARPYLEARQLFGGLVFPTSAAIGAFAQVGSWVEQELAPAHIAEVGPDAAFNGVIKMIKEDADVADAFHNAFVSAAPAGEYVPMDGEEEVVRQVLSLMFMSAGKQLTRQWRATIRTSRSDGALAIRSKLKAEVMKEVRKDAPVQFDGKMIGRVGEGSLHRLLCIVNEEAPEQLTKPSVSVSQLLGLLRAYATSDNEVDGALLKTTRKVPLAVALREAVTRRADTGFARYECVVR